ncbi:MAG: hypothetical protein V4613_08900 [Bacteroidota bacterium]
MGYEVHVVRKNDFENDEEESNITMEEWKHLVESTPELTWEQFAGDTAELDYKYCYWLAHPEQDESNRPWFDFFGGSINTKWTDPACMKLLLGIAEQLNAKLIGDDGEIYTMKEIIAMEDYNNQPTPSPTPEKKPFWKFW